MPLPLKRLGPMIIHRISGANSNFRVDWRAAGGDRGLLFSASISGVFSLAGRQGAIILRSLETF